MNWSSHTLGDVLTLKRGHDLPNSQRIDGSIPVVSSSGITGYHNEAKAAPPGVVTGRYGTIGEVFYIEESYWPLNTALYVIDFKGNSPRFVAYFLRNTLKNYQGEAAAVPGVNRNVLHKIKVRVPDIQTQQQIATVLTSYDDLIENNRRRIALLEESAQLLYKEWFVHLRFPGHEQVKVVDGFPEGWVRTTADQVMDVMSGGTPKTTNPDYWDGGIPFFTPKDATSSFYVLTTEKTLTEAGVARCNSKLYPKDTLFITARGTVGKLNLAQRNMTMNQSCYALRSKKPLNQYFLYCSLEASIQQFKARASGAVFDAIVVDTFKRIPFLLPDTLLINEFTECVQTTFNMVETLLQQNIKLTEARDLLLPRLMNGEIEV